jgi:hypothetical protein
VTSRTTARFREAFAGLPTAVQEQARRAYRQFHQNPQHPGLRFRQVHLNPPVFSARVGIHYRAVAVRDGDVWVWFWIGPHTEYDALLAQL